MGKQGMQQRKSYEWFKSDKFKLGCILFPNSIQREAWLARLSLRLNLHSHHGALGFRRAYAPDVCSHPWINSMIHQRRVFISSTESEVHIFIHSTEQPLVQSSDRLAERHLAVLIHPEDWVALHREYVPYPGSPLR
jgi:hypothetical protein